MSFADFKGEYHGVFAEMEDARSRILRNAVAGFEANKTPGVAYGPPELVERNGSYFIEWKPVGFIRQA